MKTWGVDEGLPQSSVMGVTQTPDGYLWVATKGSGVSRFDGLDFHNFDQEIAQQNGNRSINRIFTDAAGRVWVNPYTGLECFKDGRFVIEWNQNVKLTSLLTSSSNRVVFLTYQHQLLNGTADLHGKWSWSLVALTNALPDSDFAAGKEGRVWFLSTDNGVSQWTDDGCKPIDDGFQELGLPMALAANSVGRVWLGTDRGLYVWVTNHFANVSPTNGDAVTSVKKIYPANDGSLWVEADGKLRREANRQWIATAANYEKWGTELKQALTDGNGGLWVLTWHSGLIHLDAAGHMDRLTTADGLPSNVLRDLFVDREGSLWTGCDRGGLVQVRPSVFQIIGKAQGLTDTVISSVCVDHEGTVWIGTVGGTLGRWRDGQCTNIALPQEGSLCQNLVVCPDRDGRLWVGSEGAGLYIFEDGKFHRMLKDLREGGIRILLAGRDGRMWVGTSSSLRYFDHGQWTKVRAVLRIADANAALAEAPDGTIWLGTDSGGLLRFNGQGFDRFEPSFEMPASGFWSLCPESDGSLWIGTYGSGLMHFQKNSFRQFLLRPEQGWNRVSVVLDDELGNLWLGTREGLERMVKSSLKRDEAPESKAFDRRVYGRGDGLLTVATSVDYQPRCWRGGDGRLWFGTANGVASVNPQTIQPNRVPVVTIVEEVKVDGRQIMAKSPLKLRPGKHDVEIFFTAPTMVAPEMSRVLYRLVGLDDKWQEAGRHRSVRYGALPPGDYEFEVTAFNCDGVPSLNKAVLAFSVQRFFYQTRWFPPVVTLGLMSLTALILTLALRARHRRRLALSEFQRVREIERTRISQDLHDDLGASLTEISMLATPRAEQNTTDENITGRLREISAKARDSVHALDEIVWAVNPQHDSLPALVDYIGNYLEETMARSEVQPQMEIANQIPGLPISAETRHSLFLAFKEALNNVLRHAQATKVQLKINVAAEILEILISDNGIGFDSGTAKQGNGLKNFHHRLSRMGGVCQIESLPGQGTTIRFQLPLKSIAEEKS